MNDNLKGILVVSLFMLPGFSEAQVSIYTDPDSDAIIFSPPPSYPTIIAIPSYPGQTVTVPSGYGSTSTYIVSPGGYVTPSFNLEEDE